MASSKLSVLVSLAGGQVPTDLAYVDDISAGAAGSKSSTLNDLFATITKNITDLSLQFQDGAATATVSAAGQGKIRYNDTTKTFQVSTNATAYASLSVLSPPFADNAALVKNNADNTKLLIFSAASITTATTRTLTAQDSSYTIAGTTVPLGGTGVATFAANGVLFGNGAGALQVTAQGAANSILTANAGAPAFSQAPTINTSLQIGVATTQTGTLTLANSGGATLTKWQAGNAASALTFVWPIVDPTAGQVLSASAPAAGIVTLSWITGGGGGTPGGADTQIQFNNAGAFGGVTGATSAGTNIVFGSGNLRATSPRITTSIFDTNGLAIVLLTATASAVNEIAVANSATGNSPEIGVAGSDADLNLILSAKGAGVLTSAFPLTLSGSTTTLFHTPVGSDVPTKINIPLFSPGAFGQILAFGVPNTAPNSARVLTLFDNRGSGHQPTIQVFNPNEDAFLGFTWDGSNSIAQVFTDQIMQIAGSRILQKAPASAPTDADIPNSYVSFWLDEGANLLTVRVRYSGGTLKTGTVALV
jgi:hypothetical protein